jgi:hypothetical protein
MYILKFNKTDWPSCIAITFLSVVCFFSTWLYNSPIGLFIVIPLLTLQIVLLFVVNSEYVEKDNNK